MNSFPRISLSAAGLCASVSVGSAAIIADNFDSDTAANYMVVDDGTPDGSAIFAFDYSTVGIPSAPNSVGGTTSGLRLSANDTDGGTGDAEEDALTVFHTTMATGSYRLTVDIYMAVQGSSGSTEFGHVGIAGDGATFNSVFTPISGTGHFIAFTGDGGSGSDYRHFTPFGTTLPNTDPSYLGNGSNGSGETYQALFPAPTYQFPGSPGNSWATLTIDVVEGGNVTYAFNGTTIFQTPTEANDGAVSLGYSDAFDSVADPNTIFVVYDNLNVETIPESSTGFLALLGCLVALRRRR